jgi:tetratricopeptide (TPR) repeat protein
MEIMPVCLRTLLAAWLVLAVWHEAGAQDLGDPAKLLEPKPLDQRELDRRESLKAYGLGLLAERENRLLDALKHFEKAAKLDPDAAAVQRALIPLYLAVERPDDALAACKKTLELDPSDFETWYLRSRLSRGRGDTKDALLALEKALKCKPLKEKPDLYIQIATDLGVLREDQQDYAGAVAAYELVAAALDNSVQLLEDEAFTRKEIDGRAAEVYERIGNLCLRIRQFDKAVKALTKAQEKDKDLAARLNLHLAKIRQAQGKPADALRYLEQYLTLQPQGTEAYELKIKLMQEAGRADQVLAELKKDADRDSHNLALQLLLAGQYAKEKHRDEAEDRFKNVIRESPSADAYRGLFALYKEEDKASEVLDLLDTALKNAAPPKPNEQPHPGRAMAAVSSRSMLAVLRDDADLVRMLLRIADQELNGRRFRNRERETWRYLAVLAARTKQLEAAERIYRECLDVLGPEDSQQGEVYSGLLRVLWERRKLDEVVKVCQKGLREAKQLNLLVFYEHLLRALAQEGKIEEALTEAEKAVDVADDANRLYFRLYRARLLSMAEKHDKAIAECLALLKDTDDAKQVREIRYSLSGVYSAAKQHAKSEEQLRLILQADPNDDSANNDLGYIMADQGKNLEEAEQLVRKAIQLDREQKRKRADSDEGKDAEESRNRRVGADDDQDHAAYIDSLGWVLFRRGQFEAARAELEKATRLADGGDDPVIWDHLGDVYLRLKKQDQAQSAFKKAIQLYEVDKRRKKDDQYKELKQKLRLLEQ